MLTKRHLPCFALLALVACSNKKDETPKPPSQTATVVFQNLSNSNTTYDVIFDGSRIATLGPNNSTPPITATSGGHTYVFKVSNTGQLACNPASPQLVAGSFYTFSCSY